MLDSNGNYIAASSKSNNNNQGGWQNPWQQQETTTTQVGSLVYSNFSVFTANDLGISGSVKGDVNADGKFDVSDVVMMQTWIINAGGITDWTAGDFDGDNSLSVFDLAMMKNELFSK
jgi:hypothetical protein